MFVDREQEFAFLNHLAARRRPGPAQLLLLYGRRRIGKTSLLLHWSQQSGLPTTYWTAEKEPAPLQRRKLFAALSAMPLQHTPIFGSWSELWDAAARTIGDQRRVLVLDELPYAIESDPAMLSALQHAWDRAFQHSHAILPVAAPAAAVLRAESLLPRLVRRGAHRGLSACRRRARLPGLARPGPVVRRERAPGRARPGQHVLRRADPAPAR
jgi:uncharacterized protein